MRTNFQKLGIWMLINIVGWWLSFQFGQFIGDSLFLDNIVSAYVRDILAYFLLGCFQLIVLWRHINFSPTLLPLVMGIAAFFNRWFLVRVLREGIYAIMNWVSSWSPLFDGFSRYREQVVLGICVLIPVALSQILIFKMPVRQKLLWLVANFLMAYVYVVHFFSLWPPRPIFDFTSLIYESVFAGIYSLLTGLVLLSVWKSSTQPHQA
jgi:hypothetical protein